MSGLSLKDCVAAPGFTISLKPPKSCDNEFQIIPYPLMERDPSEFDLISNFCVALFRRSSRFAVGLCFGLDIGHSHFIRRIDFGLTKANCLLSRLSESMADAPLLLLLLK
jgi:hypothetical protein